MVSWFSRSHFVKRTTFAAAAAVAALVVTATIDIVTAEVSTPRRGNGLLVGQHKQLNHFEQMQKQDQPGNTREDEALFVSSFANNFPLYFRAPVLLTLVWILWGVNVYVFKKCNIDYAELLGFNRGTLLKPMEIWKLGFSIFGVIMLSFGCYLIGFPFRDVLVYPSLLYITGFFLLLMPIEKLHKPGRERLIHNLYRVANPLSSGVLFVEVVLGDVLTSISKVLADMEVTGCVLFTHGFSHDKSSHVHSPWRAWEQHVVGQEQIELNSIAALGGGTSALGAAGPSHASSSLGSQLLLSAHEYGCADSWIRPLVTSIPFLLRFRQCAVQYLATKDPTNLLNCAKYFSSLPVIWLSALAHRAPEFYPHQLRSLWYVAVSFNSFYSFMWDVIMDWGLCRQGSRYFLLREDLVYIAGSPGVASSGDLSKQFFLPSKPIVYYVAILLDFFLRILWSFKLSVHFQLSQEGLTFVLEVCEVFRRFLWLFLRIEWEYVSRSDFGPESHKPSLSDEEPDDLKPLVPSSSSTTSASSIASQLTGRIASKQKLKVEKEQEIPPIGHQLSSVRNGWSTTKKKTIVDDVISKALSETPPGNAASQNMENVATSISMSPPSIAPPTFTVASNDKSFPPSLSIKDTSLTSTVPSNPSASKSSNATNTKNLPSPLQHHYHGSVIRSRTLSDRDHHNNTNGGPLPKHLIDPVDKLR